MNGAGLVGGLGPESTIDYYRRIVAAWARDAPGTSPRLVIDSLDVQHTLQLIEHDHPALVEYLLTSVRRLAAAGSTFAAIAANTPHVVFDELEPRSPVPLISIVEVCAGEARRLGLHRALLLGTRFTMEASFYPRVFARHDIDVVTPAAEDRIRVHDRYVNQLLRGDFRNSTRRELLGLIDRLRMEARIDGVILGGTELPLLLDGEAVDGLPILDTTALHVAAIVRRLQGVTP
jgi:aspartate racemase